VKKAPDWKEIGRFLAIIVKVFTLIKKTFSQMNVGLEIVAWVVAEGTETFVDEFLKPLGKKFLAVQRVVVVNDNTIRVNLDAEPKLPFEGAVAVGQSGELGWVTVQKYEDGLYVGERKFALYLSNNQQDGNVIQGLNLKDELAEMATVHPNILDALLEHTHLIPEDLKKNDEGGTLYIYFWAVQFRNSAGRLYVRSLDFNDGKWCWGYRWLHDDLDGYRPAAVLTSN
jgi:hypothetical protein